MTTITTALVKFQAECPPIPFDSEVHFKEVHFKYASLPGILKIITPVLSKHGIALTQTINDGKFTTTFSNGESCIESIIPMPDVLTMKPQALGSWITYMRRYIICSMLGIAGEEDTDGRNADVPETKKQVDPHSTNPELTPKILVDPTQIKKMLISIRAGDVKIMERAKEKGFHFHTEDEKTIQEAIDMMLNQI